MFATIGHIADRYRIPLVVGWVVMAVLVTLLAPNLDEVTDNDFANFLAEDSSSATGRTLIEQHFPAQLQKGSVVLVFDAGPGAKVTSPANWTFIEDISLWLVGDDAPEFIQSVLSPIASAEAAGMLIAPDEQIGMVAVALNTDNLEEQKALLDTIGERLEEAPPGLSTYRTGQTAISQEYEETLINSVDRTILVTLILVIVILLAIYRSPVSPLIPLFVVTTAFLIARGIIAWLAQDVFAVSDIAVMLLIVVMYGAGTDYTLFLISRFREEMVGENQAGPAVHRTVRHVGESISSSAGTVITGFMAMAFAQLGLFNTSGPVLAIGVIVSLVAGLTLTPALLGLLGQRAFWPARAQHRTTGALYRRTSQLVSSRPLLAILIIGAIMAPFAVYGSQRQVTYDLLTDLPDDAEAVRGFQVLEQQFGAGAMQPVTAVADIDVYGLLAANTELPESWRWYIWPAYTTQFLDEIEAITRQLETVDGVAAVRSASQPLGPNNAQVAGITRLGKQLSILAALFASDQPELTPEQVSIMQQALVDLPDYLALAAERAPELAAHPAFDALLKSLSDLAQGGQLSPDLAVHLQALADVVPATHIWLGDLPRGIAALVGGDALANLVGSYVDFPGGTARFEIVLEDAPYSQAAMDTVDELRTVLKSESKSYGIDGATAINADIRLAMQADQRQTFTLILVGIFLILLVMLRSVIAPSYLLGTILLSYGSTLGITRLVSDLVWGTDQLTWWVPFYMFVFLVALGIDYSIFLFGRIKEEVGRNGVQDGIHHAVETTGSIITSAGIIVAGTFSAMMAGNIVGLAQIGFAVSIGVLIDTFVVRTVLDPALAAFFGRWTWWPGNVARVQSAPQPSLATTPLPGTGSTDWG